MSPIRTRLSAYLAVVLGLATAASAAVTDYPVTLAVPVGAPPGALQLAPCQYHSKAADKDFAADCGLIFIAENRHAPSTLSSRCR